MPLWAVTAQRRGAEPVPGRREGGDLREDASAGSSEGQVEADGRLAGGALQPVRSALSRPAARRARDESYWRRVPQPTAQVPVARQLLYHRLVPVVARRRATG